MLTPEYLEDLPEEILKLYGEAELDILRDMARRLSTYDYWIPAMDWQAQKLKEVGVAQSEILKTLSKMTNKSQDEIKRLMQEAANDVLASDKTSYVNTGLKVPSFKESIALRNILNAGYEATNQTMINLTRTTANTAARQFERVLDKTWLKVHSGGFSTDTAVLDAIKELSKQGIGAITYPNGRVENLEVAVRRAVVTGVNQTSLQLQLKLADEMGCDLVEVTAHAGARPSHAEWQGKIFSRSGKSKKYPPFTKTGYGTGAGLGGWNCRHSFSPYFEGSPRVYSDEHLKELSEKNYEYNGQKMTKYEATQQQRYNERQIRRWKRENVAAEAAGLDTTESAVKLKEWQDRQKDFLEKTGLKRQRAREQVVGFGKSEASKATQTVRRLEKQRKEAYNKKQEEIRKLIQSSETNKKLNIGNQKKHIKDSNGYIDGRSYIYGDLESAQLLVNQYSGTGEPKLRDNLEWTKKEFVVADYPIGVLVDAETGKGIETKRFSIHYGVRGTHIVPAREIEEVKS